MPQISDSRELRRASLSWPMGAADVQEYAYAATIDSELWNNKTFINVEQLTGALKIDATFDELAAGATVTITLEADGAGQTFTPGTGFLNQTAIVLGASTINVITYEYNGTGLNLISNQLSS